MKKLLLTLAMTAAAVPLAGASETLYDLSFNATNNQTAVSSYTETWNVKSNDFTWQMANFNNNGNGGGKSNTQNGQTPWTFVRFGKKSTAQTATINTLAPMPEKIESVIISMQLFNATSTEQINKASLEVLSASAAAGAAEDVVVATYEFTTQANEVKKNDASNIVINITEPKENCYYQIKFDCPSLSKNGGWQINNVKYEGTASGSVLKNPALAFPEAEYSVVFGEAFTSPKATSESTGAITYTSSDPAVASVVEATGEVTVLAIGETTITAAIAATDTYKAGTATYKLTVIDPNAPKAIFSWSKGGEEVFTFDGNVGTAPWSYDTRYGIKASGYVSGAAAAYDAVAATPVLDLTNASDIRFNFREALNQFILKGGAQIDVAEVVNYVSVVVKEEGAEEWTKLADVTAPSKFEWTYYSNDEINLDAYAGKKIQLGFRYISTEECAGTWEVDEIAVTGKISGDVPPVQTVATPVFNPASGAIEVGTKIAITCATEGATIYYTVNGDVPTAESTEYLSEIDFTEAMTVKAIAVKAGMENSEVAEASYTVYNPDDQPTITVYTFDFTDPAKYNVTLPAAGAGTDLCEKGGSVTFTEGQVDLKISATANAQNAPRCWARNSNDKVVYDFRFYDGSALQFIANGVKDKIRKIEFEQNPGATRWGCTSFDPDTFDATTKVWNGGASDSAMKNFTMQPSKSTCIAKVMVTVETESGIDDVEVSEDLNAAPVYYNLQGVRVNNPESGIYIVVKGGKSQKVVIR